MIQDGDVDCRSDCVGSVKVLEKFNRQSNSKGILCAKQIINIYYT